MAHTEVETDAATRGGAVYRCRRSVLEGEATWRLAPDALERSEGGASMQRLAYRDMSEIALAFDPTRFDARRYRCDVTSVGGSVRIVSTSYVSVGEFEDRGADYAPFVRALTVRVAHAAPKCRFRTGKSVWAYTAEHGFLLAMALLLAFVLAAVGDWSLPTIVAVKLAIIIGYVPLAIVYARRNWPRRFAPPDIPADGLPG